MIKHSIYIILLGVILSACGKDAVELSGINDTSYFPLEVGRYRIYDISQTVYNTGQAQKSTFQLREVVVDSFTNQASGITFLIERQLFNQPNQQWQTDQIWSARLSNGKVIQDEGNVQFVKLTFPLRDGAVWDGNAFNTLKEETYELDSIGKKFVIDSETSIENTVTVVQKNNQDIIVETDYRVEKYAASIGLIYKEIRNLKYCTSKDNCLGQQIVEEGIEYKQSIIAFGSE